MHRYIITIKIKKVYVCCCPVLVDPSDNVLVLRVDAAPRVGTVAADVAGAVVVLAAENEANPDAI